MYVKYPRTPHLPWSEGATDDDKRLSSTEHFYGQHVIVTEKMDGENTTLYADGHIHARSLDSRHHPSRSWVKTWWSERSYLLPLGWRICGENLFAKHSIHYTDLVSYFYGFSVWTHENDCLNWVETIKWFSKLGVVHPMILFNGIYDEDFLMKMNTHKDPNIEGYVIRLACMFKFKHFETSVAKWVRKDHVQSEEHWMHQEMVKNVLMEV